MTAPTPAQAASAALVLRAREVAGKPDGALKAEGQVELRRAGMLLRAEALDYDAATDRADARGAVQIRRPGLQVRAPRAQVQTKTFQGVLQQPEFSFDALGTQGRAERLELFSANRAQADKVDYSSCRSDGTGMPDWLLSAEKLHVDIEANEGIAEGAVLRFLGVPILALPTISFPVTSARKSGWLPPSLYVDTRSGVELAVPYYLNLAPEHDLTLTPRVITRRGLGLQAQARYLRTWGQGELDVDTIPKDAVAGRSRLGLNWKQEASPAPGLRIHTQVERVSDDEWWKDFPRAHQAFTARLLPSRLQVAQDLAAGSVNGQAYAGGLWWQTLQATDSPITTPYQRAAQLGLALRGPLPGGLQWAVQSELNRFTLGPGSLADSRPEGWRWHAQGQVSWPWAGPGWWVTPRALLNLARYRTDEPMPNGGSQFQRSIPSFSLDSGLEFERETSLFGRGLRQTLEPRLYYVNTPYRAQDDLPSFDATGKDFNLNSIYSENAFSGVDRVSDAHQVTAGFTTRWLDAASGAEALRLSMVQRYLFRQQRITPEGEVFTRHLSDLLLLASTNVLPELTLDARVQYSPDIQRPVRSILGARFSPGPYRTVGASYRFARGLSELVDVGWQWPVYSGSPTSGQGCQGTLYSVGRASYSMRDSRLTDALVGMEYDAGCWIARLAAERLSTGLSTATTRYHLQLELVGLSRLGSNPLRVLKDNIVGYRLLRDEERERSPTPPPYE